MIPEKVYIIRISSTISQAYAADAARSCEAVGLDYEFFEGFENMKPAEVWKKSGLSLPPITNRFHALSTDKATCCTASHMVLWDKIYKQKECAIILEHDAIMLHKPTISIPDDTIVTLGYKLRKPSEYDHISAGPPTSIKLIPGHEGAHAYAINWKTADELLEELKRRGVQGPIDNNYFLRTRRTKTKLAIMDPTPAIGWIRESTIWHAASDKNYDFIDSFKKNLHSDK